MSPTWLLRSLMVLLVHVVVLCQGKLDVHFHALIPHHFAWAEEFKRALLSKLWSFRRDRRYMSMFRTFRATTNVTFLKQDSPDEILNTFCDVVFPSHTTVILHINNPLSIRRRTSANQYVNELTDFFGIPLISWDAEFSGSSYALQEARTLQIAPTIQHMSSAMLKLLMRYNWTDFAIVTTTVAGNQDFIASIRSKAEESQNAPKYSPDGVSRVRFKILCELILRDAKNQTRSMREMGELIRSNVRVILLHSSGLESKYILDYARAMGITTADYVWILTQTAIPTAKIAPSSFHLGMLGVSYDHSRNSMENAIKTAVTIWVTALKDIASKRGVASKLNIVPHQTCNSTGKIYWEEGKHMYRYMKNISITTPTPIAFNESGTLRYTELKIINIQQRVVGKKWIEVGRVKQNELIMQDITWPGEASIPPRGKPEKSFVRIATLRENPYVIYVKPEANNQCTESAARCRIYERDENKKKIYNRTTDWCCVGLSIDLLKQLSVQLEFDFDLFEVEDFQWGALDSTTKQWNGLVRVLIDGKADMVMTSLKITPERNAAVDFSVPYLETGITIVVSIREGAISPTAFLEPYDYPSWCLILVFCVHTTGTSIFIFEWLSPYGLNQGKTTLREHKFSLFRSFWLIWAMLFGAAVSTDTPRGIASRMMANLWALFALVFLASYTANLAAFMITKEEYFDLSGIGDWRLKNPTAMQPPFKYATIPNGSTETNIKNNHKDIYRYMKKFNLPTVEEGILALKHQKIHAFIYDATVLEYYVGKDKGCRLRTVGSWYAMTGYGVAFPRGSPWVNKVNRVLLQLQNDGEMERLQKFWLAGACHKMKEKKGVSSHTLGILNFTSAFILLACGMVLGGILLALEHCYFKFGRDCMRKCNKSGCCTLISLSLGKSLTFEQSVMEAIDLHKKTRCKNAMCETQMWKLRHELDLALLKIDNLQNSIRKEEDNDDEDNNRDIILRSKQQQQQQRPRQPNGVPGRRVHYDDDNRVDRHPVTGAYHVKRANPSKRDNLNLVNRRSPTTRSNYDPSNGIDWSGPHRSPLLEPANRHTLSDVSPTSKANFRRSPSYVSAISEDSPNSESADLQNRTRVYDGKLYFGVDCSDNNCEAESEF
ncbi:LOW QUALITY PROTEIN: glutamate receptor ionotropic, NMDA 2B-like [Gigantopelta aegis]|uniref:LOW QUALITY PROTEIN: glutamate receptor ionotropic, NMDA 2B-like n=1 Tax=Gigantopelta aegis TaxID=1735272 RepID=UPI001B88E2DE|nr:LOW QUALITY PROTEIN: glutamate receptor ionotropic, NMDA 2B-like [Gigantopelta aegis]